MVQATCFQTSTSKYLWLFSTNPATKHSGVQCDVSDAPPGNLLLNTLRLKRSVMYLRCSARKPGPKNSRSQEIRDISPMLHQETCSYTLRSVGYLRCSTRKPAPVHFAPLEISVISLMLHQTICSYTLFLSGVQCDISDSPPGNLLLNTNLSWVQCDISDGPDNLLRCGARVGLKPHLNILMI